MDRQKETVCFPVSEETETQFQLPSPKEDNLECYKIIATSLGFIDSSIEIKTYKEFIDILERKSGNESAFMKVMITFLSEKSPEKKELFNKLTELFEVLYEKTPNEAEEKRRKEKEKRIAKSLYNLLENESNYVSDKDKHEINVLKSALKEIIFDQEKITNLTPEIMVMRKHDEQSKIFENKMGIIEKDLEEVNKLMENIQNRITQIDEEIKKTPTVELNLEIKERIEKIRNEQNCLSEKMTEMILETRKLIKKPELISEAKSELMFESKEIKEDSEITKYKKYISEISHESKDIRDLAIEELKKLGPEKMSAVLKAVTQEDWEKCIKMPNDITENNLNEISTSSSCVIL